MARGRKATPATTAQLAAAAELAHYYEALGAGKTWAAVGIHYGINKGLAQAVALGTTKAPPAVLLALGLAEQTAPAPVCPIHHVVHVMPGCPDQYEVRRRPRRDHIADWPAKRLRAAFENRRVMVLP